jgi:ParB family chromosome partitioning protein
LSKVTVSPYQPRRTFDEAHLQELANSIQSEGLMQPIVVRPVGDQYQLIAGERRFRACQMLGLKKIPARILNVSDASSAVLAMIENLQREGLNPIEEGLGYASLMRDFHLTQEAVAERVGKGRATVANSLRLLQLDREIQGYLGKGLISSGHAKVLLGVEDESQRLLIARRVVENSLSVRETERLVRQAKASAGAANRAARTLSNPSAVDQAIINDLEKQLCSKLNTKVYLKHTPKRGKIIIEYFGNEDLQRILERTGLDG